MKKIYVYGVFTGRSAYGYIQDAEPCGDVMGYAIDGLVEDQGEVKMTAIATHLSSGITWCKHDMGITSDWHHDVYDAMYPDGYELVWLGCFDSEEDAYENVLKQFDEVSA